MSTRPTEIGGYIEFEHFAGTVYHPKAIALNCGRGCLRYLIEAHGIKKIVLPDLICESVIDCCNKMGVKVRRFPIRDNFMLPSLDIQDNEWLLIVDYYGQLSQCEVDAAWVSSRGKLIVDETQGFFRSCWHAANGSQIDTMYTCRKFFGVADGGYLYTDAYLTRELPFDESRERMGFLMGRFERSASEYYSAYAANNDYFDNQPVKQMSQITENILRAVDYRDVKLRREENWSVLHEALSAANGLELHQPEGPFMYPLQLGESAQKVRKRLILEKIYIPLLWPNVIEDCSPGTPARALSEGLLPLPIDQRYDATTMKIISKEIERCLS